MENENDNDNFAIITLQARLDHMFKRYVDRDSELVNLRKELADAESAHERSHHYMEQLQEAIRKLSMA